MERKFSSLKQPYPTMEKRYPLTTEVPTHPTGKWYVLGLSPALIPTLEALLEPSKSFRVRLKDEDLLYQEGGYD